MNENVMDEDRVAAIDKVRAAFSNLEPDEGGAALIQLLADLHDRAVEAERERLLTALDEARGEAAKNADYPLTASLRDCREAFLVSNVEPPRPEPMTVEKVRERLQRIGGRIAALANYWPQVEADLILLVQAQARRDAETCSGLAESDKTGLAHGYGCRDCQYAILKSAGLE